MYLREARKRKLFNQLDLKAATGIDQSVISLFENGYRVPSQKESKLIHDKLGYKPGEITFKLKD